MKYLFLKVIFLVSTYAFAYDATIKGRSMEPLLKAGEIVKVEKDYYRDKTPKREELVTFKFAHHKFPLVKKIKALPRDLVEFKDSVIFVNAKVLTNSKGEEIKITSAQVKRLSKFLIRGKLKRNHFFVFSDNPKNKYDSREYGAIFRFQLSGRVSKEVSD